MTAAIILLYSTRTTPVTVGQTEKIYHEYAKKHEGIADQTLIEALQQEKEQFDKLRQRQVELTEKNKHSMNAVKTSTAIKCLR